MIIKKMWYAWKREKSVRDNEEIKNMKRCECLVSIKEAIQMIKCIGIIPHNKSKQKQKRPMFEFLNSFCVSCCLLLLLEMKNIACFYQFAMSFRLTYCVWNEFFFCRSRSVQLLHVNTLQQEHKSTSSCVPLYAYGKIHTHTHEIKRRKAALYLQTWAQHGICFSVTRHSFSLSDLCIPCY